MPVQYRSQDVLIECFCTRLGKYEVRLNGQVIVSGRKLGKVIHDFKVFEAGQEIDYRIVKYLDETLGHIIDIIRGGEPVLIAHPMIEVLSLGVTEQQLADIIRDTRHRIIRSRGLEKLANYELREAEAYLKKDIELHPTEGDLHLRLATIYSMTERTKDSLEALEKAIAHNPELKNNILVADGLAYTRLQPEFKAFKGRHYLI